MNLNTVS